MNYFILCSIIHHQMCVAGEEAVLGVADASAASQEEMGERRSSGESAATDSGPDAPGESEDLTDIDVPVAPPHPSTRQQPPQQQQRPAATARQPKPTKKAKCMHVIHASTHMSCLSSIRV